MPFTSRAILGRAASEEKILDRFHSLATLYEQLIRPKYPNTFLQQCVLRHTIENYFCDLQHSKDFHNITLADNHKVAAFTIKWIVKTRPIQLNAEGVKKSGELIINEMFALMVGLRFLGADIKEISDNLLRSLLYTLHNRTVDAEAMSAMMYTIECALNSKKP
jgi:hypothetical protein